MTKKAPSNSIFAHKYVNLYAQMNKYSEKAPKNLLFYKKRCNFAAD